MIKGKNGQQKATENVASVVVWIAERNRLRDWHEYAYNNRINRRVIAEELSFAKSVCTLHIPRDHGHHSTLMEGSIPL